MQTNGRMSFFAQIRILSLSPSEDELASYDFSGYCSITIILVKKTTNYCFCDIARTSRIGTLNMLDEA